MAVSCSWNAGYDTVCPPLQNQEYDLIVKNMSSELTRFQTQRAAEISEVLREFAIAQAKLASDTAKAWRQVIPEIAAHAAKA